MHLQGTSKKFDDSQLLPLEKTYKIKNLSFTWFEEHILGLTTQYQLPDQTTKDIETFKINHSYKNTKKADLAFHQFEYIKEMQIYCSKFIEFLRIRTSRDQIFEVGNEKNSIKCKKFTFDIRTSEKPISMMGAIESKKLGNDNSKEHLISIGLQIKKKEIFTKTRFHASMRSESLVKKNVLKNPLQQSPSDDKNLKVQE